jgi:hypothetical protein
MFRALILLLGLCCIAADAPGPPVFVVHSASGNPIKGSLKQIDEKWTAIVGDARARVEGGELISLRRADVPLPASPPGPQVIFTNGDRLPGTVGKLTGTRLAFTSSVAGDELALPLTALSVLWLDNPADATYPERLRRRLLSERRTRDLLWLKNGDQLQGSLLRLDAQTAVIEVESNEVKVDRAKIAVVALSNDVPPSLKPPTNYGLLVLTNGGRISVASVQADAKTLTAKTLVGATLKAPLDQVAALDIFQGRAVYLSDLKPKAYQYVPFLDAKEPSFSWTADQSVAGDDLKLGASTFVKGLGMHSESRISYALDGAYRRFEAVVGLDGTGDRRAEVRIQVLVDGKPCPWGWDKALTVQTGPKDVRVDIAGARELTLVVEHGQVPFVQGRVGWGDARLVK